VNHNEDGTCEDEECNRDVLRAVSGGRKSELDAVFRMRFDGESMQSRRRGV
jgi:hypothetical protein